MQSDYYRQQQEVKLDKDLAQSIASLVDLPVSRKGKKVLNSLEEIQSSVNKILKDNKLETLLLVNVKQTKHTKNIRDYGSKPARKEEY